MYKEQVEPEWVALSTRTQVALLYVFHTSYRTSHVLIIGYVLHLCLFFTFLPEPSVFFSFFSFSFSFLVSHVFSIAFAHEWLPLLL